MNTDRPGDDEPLVESVRRRHARSEEWKRTGERPLGRNLAMIGAFGWLIVAPTLAGLFVGRWLDRSFGSGVFWSAGLMFAGVVVGGWLTWRKMQEETRE